MRWLRATSDDSRDTNHYSLLTIHGTLITTHPSRVSPTSGLQQILFVHLADVEALHGVAQLLRRFQDSLGILVMRCGLHDRACAHGRIAGLENARADEHRFCA